MSSEDTTNFASADPLKPHRRVQWSDSTHSHQNALDESALDAGAFNTLAGALERHQSTHEPKQPRVHHFPPRKPHGQPPALDTTIPSIAVSDGSPSTARTSPLTPSSPFPEEQHIIPGQYIDENEHDGVPLANADSEVLAKNQAADIVRSHTKRSKGSTARRWFSARRNHPAREDSSRSRVKTRDFGPTVDIERDAESSAAGAEELPGGLLSALLTLYGDGQNFPSGMVTPDSVSARSSFEGLPEKPWIQKPPPIASTPHKEESSYFDEKAGPSKSPPSSTPNSPTRPEFKAKLSKTFKSAFGARPQNERNAAGTVASLIASTGNISGVAAPHPSRLQPNLKRPGYTLSRYSLDEKVPTQQSLGLSKHQPSKSVGAGESSSTLDTLELSHRRAQSGAVTPTSIAGTPILETPDPLKSPSYTSKWTGKLNLKDLPGGRSGASTPGSEWSEWIWESGKKTVGISEEKRKRGEREKKRKRKKAEIFITKHVAEIIQRQQFICKLARAMMMFGGPSHRLQSQIQATARVLEISLSCLYLPDVMLISFDDGATGTSQIKFIRQSSSLDLQKLTDAYARYWEVIHDDLSVAKASAELDALMKSPPCYTWWQLCLIGGMASSAICTLSFSGSFIDALVVFPMGALLVGVQLLSVRNELYSNVFEITMAMLFSFLSAALASTHQLCYSAMASSAVVLILPGFIVLGGALEIMSRNIISGAVRMMYAVIYCLFLGFGLAMGGKAWATMRGEPIYGTTDYTCSYTHDQSLWYRRTPSLWWAFLTVPLFATSMSLRNMCSWRQDEFPVLIGIACIGWVTNHFTSTKFINQSDFCAAVGAFAVGIVANVWARVGLLTGNNAFVIMITGILLQLPSGLGAGGLLGWVSDTSADSSSDPTSYISGFQTSLQLVSVAIGLTVGLGISLVIVNPIQSRKRQGAVFSL